MTKTEVTAFFERLRPMVLISQTLDALREHCNDPTYRPHYLVLEAVRVAKERDNAEGLAAIEKACRAVLDDAWSPRDVYDEETGSTWPATIPRMLRAAEAHLLFHRIATEATDVIAAAIAGRKSHDDAWTSAQEIVGVLRLYAEHFPGGRDSDALDAIIDCANRGLNPVGPVLRAWGSPASVVKHVQRSILRRRKT